MKTGYILDINESSWNKIEKRARWSINKARKYLEVKPGTLQELKILHWDPPHLPLKLKRNQKVFTAYYKDIPVSSILVEKKGNKLIYSKAASRKDYNYLNGNSFLLYYLVFAYENSEIKYIDLGGSEHKGIDLFKRQFATRRYLFESPKGGIRFLKKLWVRFKRTMIKIGLIK
ncbi:MAG: hypothetical protein ACFFDN_32370 [Candidatus Hodarchaeota archaeon]